MMGGDGVDGHSRKGHEMMFGWCLDEATHEPRSAQNATLK